MKIIQDFIPIARNRRGFKMTPEWITVHETGNPSRGANAAMHARYIKSPAAVNAPVSWHYTVDDREIWQHIPIDEVAWHAGDGASGPGNRRSIGVEICINADGDFEQAKRNAQWLIAHLMAITGIDEVVQHNRWNGSDCPRTIRSTGWREFLAGINPTMEDKVHAFQRAYGLTVGEITHETVEKARQVQPVLDHIMKNAPQAYIVRSIRDIMYVAIDPLQLRYEDLSRRPTRTEHVGKASYINGPFFFPGDRPIWMLAQDGKKIYDVKGWDYRLGSKGTFAIYKNGNVGIANMYSMADVSTTHLAVQGYNLDAQSTGSKSIDESISKQSFDAGVGRRTGRTAIAWHPVQSKVYILSGTGTPQDIVNAAIDLGCVNNGRPQGIGLDGGSRHAFKVNGTVIHNGGSTQEHILYF